MYPQSHQDTETEIIAHMTPSEVRELIELQGRPLRDERNGLPSFKELERVFFSPGNHGKIQEWARSGYAGGGEVDGLNDYIRRSGNHGDTMAVVLPRSVADLFDHALGITGRNHNQKTGKREYFLGSLLGSIKNLVSPIVNAGSDLFHSVSSAVNPFTKFLSNTVMPAAQSVASTVAPIAGQVLSQATPQLANMAQNAITNAGGGGSLGNLAGQFAGSAANSIGNNIAESMMQGHIPSVSNLKNMVSGGMNYGVKNTLPSAANVASRHLSSLGNSYGANSLPSMLGNMGSNILEQAGPELAGLL